VWRQHSWKRVTTSTFYPEFEFRKTLFFLHGMTSVTKTTMMPLIYLLQADLRPGCRAERLGMCHYQWLQNLWHSRSPRKARLNSSCMILLLPKAISYSSLSSSFRNARLIFFAQACSSKATSFPLLLLLQLSGVATAVVSSKADQRPKPVNRSQCP